MKRRGFTEKLKKLRITKFHTKEVPVLIPIMMKKKANNTFNLHILITKVNRSMDQQLSMHPPLPTLLSKRTNIWPTLLQSKRSRDQVWLRQPLMKRKWMMFSLSTFINKITKNKKWYPKNPKNIMRNKIKQTKKKIIKLTTPTKKLKSTWKVWTKPRMTKWIRNKNKMPSTSII